MKAIHRHQHLLGLGSSTTLLALRPGIDHCIKHIGVGPQVRMAHWIALVESNHVRQQSVRTRSSIAFHGFGKGINHRAICHHIGFDRKVTLVIHNVHALEEVFCLLSSTLPTRFGIGIDDDIVSDCVRLNARIPLPVHLVHIVKDAMCLRCTFLRTTLCVSMDDRVEGVLVRADVEVLAALVAEFFHPGENLLGTCRGNLLAGAGPCLPFKRVNEVS
mmetsp:Transcript_26396/g.47832  ORF Transcript_26396/g.47832 Transcript_26396/m.47832 type:complete len:217 (-) Transcript_26396:1732-2382(-)